MTQEEVLEEFRGAGALLNGHFILTSGRRSPIFLQKMFVFMYPDRTERLCKALAQKVEATFGKIDIVVSPAVGGIVPGYETARHLKAKSIFVERENGKFALRRGFDIPQGARVLVVDDILTTGLSYRETLEAIRPYPGTIVGAAHYLAHNREYPMSPMQHAAHQYRRAHLSDQSSKPPRQSCRGKGGLPPKFHDRTGL